MIAIPKRLREGQSVQQRVASADFASIETRAIASALTHESAEDAITIARMKNMDARTGKLQKQKVGPHDVWRAAATEAFPHGVHSGWSIKDKGRVKQFQQSWIGKVQGHTFNDFIMWVALNWTQIIAKSFSWMNERTPPSVPDIGFVLGFRNNFIEAFSERALEKWLNDRERTELERLMDRGMGRDEALRELGKVDAIKKLRKEMEDRENRVRAQAAAARADRRQAEKDARMVERYGGNVPVHPRSRLAQEKLTTARTATPGVPPPHDMPLQAPKVKFDD